MASAHRNRSDDIFRGFNFHAVGSCMGSASHCDNARGVVLADGFGGGRALKQNIVRDVSTLPTYGFGSESGPWWGAIAFIALEGMGFALAIGAYLYLFVNNPKWPLSSPPPDLRLGSTMTVLLLVSAIPNELTNRVARRLDLRLTWLGMVAMSGIGCVALLIRGFEFAYLN